MNYIIHNCKAAICSLNKFLARPSSIVVESRNVYAKVNK